MMHVMKIIKPLIFKKSFAIGSLAAITLLSAVGLHFVPRLKSEYSMRQFLPPEHELLASDHAIKEKFHGSAEFIR